MPFTLPSRPLRASPPGMGLAGDIWLVFLALFVSAGFVVVVIFPVPALLTDLAVRETAKPMAGATIEHGSCSTKLFLVSCEATLSLSWPEKPPLRRTLHYFFVHAHTGDYTARVVVDPSRPEDMTTDLALEKLDNRVLTLAIGGPISVAIVGFCLFGAFRLLRRHRAVRRALSGQILRPATLRIVASGRRVIRTTYTRPDGKVATERWKIPAKSRPIVLDSKARTILGVTAGDGMIAMPLDADLKWIGLTKEERAERS